MFSFLILIFVSFMLESFKYFPDILSPFFLENDLLQLLKKLPDIFSPSSLEKDLLFFVHSNEISPALSKLSEYAENEFIVSKAD